MTTTSEKQQNDDLQDDDNRLQILGEYIALIKERYKETEVYEPQMTVSITTEDISEKIKKSTGFHFDNQSINEAMQKEGFRLVFISVENLTPDYYYLMQPII